MTAVDFTPEEEPEYLTAILEARGFIALDNPIQVLDFLMVQTDGNDGCFCAHSFGLYASEKRMQEINCARVEKNVDIGKAFVRVATQ